MQPHVFVVMPFGVKEALSATPATGGAPARPAVKIDFDQVHDLLIGPALTRAGCVPFRADREPGAGDIRTDMYFELVTADVILADISILNANVFYELGVRHGVAPRGVLMIHGGWAKRPFDVAPDRTFDYDGKLFVSEGEERDEAWRMRLDAEVERLSITLRDALEVDGQTIGSPVYKELAGLKPVDWSDIRTARAKYFGEVFTDWKARVEVAKRNGRPGDILTLADDAPTRFHRGGLLWEAAFALISMRRFDVARSVLEELVGIDPSHHKAQTQLGLVLARLGKMNEARVHMERIAEQCARDTEAQGILGRVFKDFWRLEWKDLETLEERQQQAVATSSLIAAAIRSYNLAVRKHRDYYNGINVVSFVELLDHLRSATGEEPVDCRIDDLEDLIAVVRFAARSELDCTGPGGGRGEDVVWATATLGELELVADNVENARQYYREAANAPDATTFQIGSMLEQIALFESLGFRPEGVAAVKKVLEQRRKILDERISGLKKVEPRFKKVVVCSGHMIDQPGRSEERFPPGKKDAVRERIAGQLDLWAIGPGDLAICGGARGADILFAELCAERGARVWLFLALPLGLFLEESVRLPDSDWEERFFALRDRPGVEVFVQKDRLKSPPKSISVYSRNNLWIINTARVEADDPKSLHAVLVWDEKPTGDGPGGTSDFAARIKQLGGRLAPVINPTKL